LLLAGTSARAAESDAPRQLAGLFMQSCLAFAGDAAALRDWAKQVDLAQVPEPARTAFLRGASGIVFDASNASGKFVIVSADQGSCSAVTNAANGAAVIDDLEADLTQAAVQFRLTGERDDDQEATLHYREYTGSRNGRRWRIAAATVKARKAGQAMLTADTE
jgi:hypothetical protein